MSFFTSILSKVISALIHLGDFSILKSCYFYFNESELDQELFESKN